jgi:hypothetical protein
MGFQAVKALLASQIRDITPVRDTTAWFTYQEDSTGAVLPMDLNTRMVQTREFDLRIILFPQDDGESGLSNRRQRTKLALRVAYRMDGDRGYAEDMAAEDIAYLVDALVKTPTASGWGEAGGYSVGIPEAPSITVLEPVGDENPDPEFDNAMIFVVSIPFFVFYAED